MSLNTLLQQYSDVIASTQLLLMVISALVHIFFAGAVARDAGQLHKNGQPIFLVSGITWAFATLIGGVIVAAIYWVMHHIRFNQKGP